MEAEYSVFGTYTDNNQLFGVTVKADYAGFNQVIWREARKKIAELNDWTLAETAERCLMSFICMGEHVHTPTESRVTSVFEIGRLEESTRLSELISKKGDE